MIRSLVAGAFIVVPVALGPGSDDAGRGRAAWSGGGDAGGIPTAPGLIAERVASSGDNEGLPFVVIDKAYGQLYVFDSQGELQALTRAAQDESGIEKLLADNRMVVYVLPEAAGADPSHAYIRYASRHR
jgi:hypothetical protein